MNDNSVMNSEGCADKDEDWSDGNRCLCICDVGLDLQDKFVTLINSSKVKMARLATYSGDLQNGLQAMKLGQADSQEKLDSLVTLAGLINPDHCGWLMDQSCGKRRFCVLADMLFCMFETESSPVPLKVILLPGHKIRSIMYKSAKWDVISQKPGSASNPIPSASRTITGLLCYNFLITDPNTGSSLTLAAETQVIRDTWVAFLKIAANLDAEIFESSDSDDAGGKLLSGSSPADCMADPSHIPLTTSEGTASASKSHDEFQSDNLDVPAYVPSQSQPDAPNRQKRMSQEGVGNITETRKTASQTHIYSKTEDSPLVNCKDINDNTVLSSPNQLDPAPVGEKFDAGNSDYKHRESVPKPKRERYKSDGMLKSTFHKLSRRSSLSDIVSPVASAKDNIKGVPRTPSFSKRVVQKANSFKEKMLRGNSLKIHLDFQKYGTLTDIVKSGNLFCKQSLKWKSMHCVVCHGHFHVYKCQNEEELPEISFPLSECSISKLDNDESHRFSFKICHLNARSACFAAQSDEDFQNWMEILRKDTRESSSKSQAVINGHDRITSNKGRHLLSKPPIKPRDDLKASSGNQNIGPRKKSSTLKKIFRIRRHSLAIGEDSASKTENKVNVETAQMKSNKGEIQQPVAVCEPIVRTGMKTQKFYSPKLRKKLHSLQLNMSSHSTANTASFLHFRDGSSDQEQAVLRKDTVSRQSGQASELCDKGSVDPNSKIFLTEEDVQDKKICKPKSFSKMTGTELQGPNSQTPGELMNKPDCFENEPDHETYNSSCFVKKSLDVTVRPKAAGSRKLDVHRRYSMEPAIYKQWTPPCPARGLDLPGYRSSSSHQRLSLAASESSSLCPSTDTESAVSSCLDDLESVTLSSASDLDYILRERLIAAHENDPWTPQRHRKPSDTSAIYNRRLPGPNREGLMLVNDEDDSSSSSEAEENKEGGAFRRRSLSEGNFVQHMDPDPHRLSADDAKLEIKVAVPAQELEAPACSGYLDRWEGGEWRSYWLVLKASSLYLYTSPHDNETVDLVSLPGYEVVTCDTFMGRELVFELVHSDTFTQTISAESPSEFEKWLDCIRDVVEKEVNDTDYGKELGHTFETDGSSMADTAEQWQRQLVRLRKQQLLQELLEQKAQLQLQQQQSPKKSLSKHGSQDEGDGDSAECQRNNGTKDAQLQLQSYKSNFVQRSIFAPNGRLSPNSELTPVLKSASASGSPTSFRSNVILRPKACTLPARFHPHVSQVQTLRDITHLKQRKISTQLKVDSLEKRMQNLQTRKQKHKFRFGLGKHVEVTPAKRLPTPINRDNLEKELIKLRRELATIEHDLGSKQQHASLLSDAIATPIHIGPSRRKGTTSAPIRTNKMSSTSSDFDLHSLSSRSSELKMSLPYDSLGSTPSSEAGDPFELSTSSLSSELERMRLWSQTPPADGATKSSTLFVDSISVTSTMKCGFGSGNSTASNSLESLEDVLDKMAQHRTEPSLQRSWENLLEGITKPKNKGNDDLSDHSEKSISKHKTCCGNPPESVEDISRQSSHSDNHISQDSLAKIAAFEELLQGTFQI